MKLPVIRRDKLSDHEFFLLKKESLSNPHNDIIIHEFIVRQFSDGLYIVASIGRSRKEVHICNSYTEFMNAYSELKLERML